MIPGFEEHTFQLNIEEKAMARRVWRIIRDSKKPIKNSQIRKRMEEEGVKCSAPKVRKMINWMHTNGHLKNLIASSQGYSFAKSRQELMDYQKSLEGRISAIYSRYLATKRDVNEWKKGAEL